MSTQFTNRQWRLPNNENKDKQSNYSMDFDGSNDRIQFSSTLVFSGEFSFNWWMNPVTYGGNGSTYIWGRWGTNTDFLKLNSNSSLTLQIGGTSRTFTKISGGNTIDLNVWNQVCFTRDSSNNIKVYVNGDLFSSSSASTTLRVQTLGRIISNSFGYKGKLDSVSFFDYALSSSQVTTLYGSSSTGIGNPMSLSPKPVAYYPLGDQDAFNGSNYLVPNSSLKDYVFDFDGSNDYIGCGDSDDFSFGDDSNDSPFSVSAWIKVGDTGINRIVNKVGGSDAEWLFSTGTANRTLVLNLYSSGATTSGPNRGVAGSTSLNNYINQWVHVACSYDGRGDNTAYDGMKLYLNGQLETTTNLSSVTDYTAMGNTVAPLRIGSDIYFTNNYFNGSISNVQIFNTELSATGTNSVETLYNNGSPLTSMTGFTSLVGWWKLDASATYDSSTTTWTIPDDSTNSNDGTSSGMTQANLVQSDLSFTSGYSPYALSFDSASSDNIIVNSNTGLNFGTGDFTYSLWGKINTTTSNPAFYGGGSGSNNPAANSGYLSIGVHTSQPTGYVGASRCWISGEVFNGTTIITDDNWHNIVLTRTSGVVQIYVDGNIEVMRDSSGNVVSNPASSNSITNTNGISIGSFRTNANYINGSMSNASIWNTALTSAQASEIYNEGVPSNLNNHSAYSNLVSWWQLGSNSSFNTNWTVLDEKGSNNGTSVNMGEDAIVDGVGSYANGVSSGMSDNIVGSAPFSDANSLSYNMDILDRTDDTPS